MIIVMSEYYLTPSWYKRPEIKEMISDGKAFSKKVLTAETAEEAVNAQNDFLTKWDPKNSIYDIHAKINGTTPIYEKNKDEYRRKLTHEIAESIRKNGSHPLIEKAKEQAKNSQSSVRKSLNDFDFERAARIDANGKVSYIDLPVDRKGYAETFARNMAEMSKGKSYDKEYDYWYKYIMNRMSSQ